MLITADADKVTKRHGRVDLNIRYQDHFLIIMKEKKKNKEDYTTHLRLLALLSCLSGAHSMDRLWSHKIPVV